MIQNKLTGRYKPDILREMLNSIAVLSGQSASIFFNSEMILSTDRFVSAKDNADSTELAGLSGDLLLRNYSDKTIDLIIPFEYDFDSGYELIIQPSSEEIVFQDGRFILTDEMKNKVGHFQNFLRFIVEDSLLSSNLLNNISVDSLEDFIIVVDRDLKVTFVNKSFELYAAKTSWKAEDILGTNIFDIFPYLPSKFIQEYRTILETGETVVSETVSLIDGEIKVTEARKIPIFKAEKVIGVLSVIRDIAKRRIAEAKLKESEIKYRQLYSEMNEGLALHEMIYDDDNNPVDFTMEDVNRAYEKSLGIKKRDIIGKLASEIYGRTSPFIEIADQVLKSGVSQTYEHYAEELDKHLLIACFSPAEGKFANIFHDVTDKVRALKKNADLSSELKAKNKESRQFTYAVSHDLKSPLITIKGFMGLIADDLAEGNYDRIPEDLVRISNASDKMDDLLDDILNLSRIGFVVNNPVIIPINKLISEVIELLHGTISEKNVTVKVSENMPDLFADYRRISEVFQNLIENSIKFSSNQKEPKIEISCEMKGEIPEFHIRDYGIGIDEEDQRSIFVLFNKIDDSYSGSGVGLSIVKRICELRGGYIKVDSQGLNKGTVFKFTFTGE
ncbi:MAG: PAS domain-containing sensor histidine kinase [Candidatus Kapabacteria bacterium]|jgi:PAS domain S-box-containing protein|nr:PAS domain-containing sensor histidine kinase [Candidatus Kapabacteria bacterium]